MPTDFSQVKFDKATHRYTLNGRTLTSVTKIISQLKQPFDADYWSQVKADERGVSKEVILKEWEAKRQASIEKGNKVHQHIEKVLWGRQTKDDPFLALNDQLPEIQAFDALWAKIKDDVIVQKVEWVIGDAELGIAGTVDAVLFSHRTGCNHIWDWKTGEKLRTTNKFQNLLPPFDDLSECEVNVYALQTALYSLIIERSGDYHPLSEAYIVHLAPQGIYQIYSGFKLTERLTEWLISREVTP